MERDTLEHQLFDWEEWDGGDTNMLMFTRVTLKVPIGEWPAGSRFESAVWLGEASILALKDEQGQEHAYEIKVSIGEKLDLVIHDESCGCGHTHT